MTGATQGDPKYKRRQSIHRGRNTPPQRRGTAHDRTRKHAEPCESTKSTEQNKERQKNEHNSAAVVWRLRQNGMSGEKSSGNKT